MKKYIRGIFGPLLLAASSAAIATPMPSSVGLMAVTGTLDCAGTSDGGCQWHAANPSGYDTLGSASHTALSASSSVTDVRGTASASGEANLATYLPSLHAVASSNGAYTADFAALAGTKFRSGTPDILYTGEGASIADANVWAVQGYQYTGESAFELSVTATLDSIFSASGALGKIGHSAFAISIFDVDGFVFDADADGLSPTLTHCAIMNLHTGFCAGSPTNYAAARGGLYDTGSLSLTIKHILNPGDRFFVGAFLDASVCCGKTVDSSHTLNLEFNDFTQLDSLAVPGVVPEPESLLLLATGLGLMAARARRRTQRPCQ